MFMRFTENAAVLAANGDKVGEVERVVVYPRTRQVTHLVVRKGFLFKEDKVVPVDLVASAIEDAVTLRPDAGDLEVLPDFEEEHLVIVDERELARYGREGRSFPAPVYSYPPFGAAPPVAIKSGDGSGHAEPVVTITERNVPDETVALEEGAKVISADDEHVGDVEQVLTGPQADRVTHFVIADGLLLKERKLIPSQWVSTMAEDRVELAVGSDLLKSLPEYDV
jgi:uncharacterized protein YrrD